MELEDKSTQDQIALIMLTRGTPEQQAEALAYIQNNAIHKLMYEQRGSPGVRFTCLMDELEKRFPNPNPYDSSRVPESYVLEAIDELIERSKAK